MLPHLFEVHYNATFFHHGVLFIVLHQVSQGVEPLSTTHVVLAILLRTKISTSILNSWCEDFLGRKKDLVKNTDW